MSARQAAVFIPLLVLSIYFAAFYFNIRAAKKRVSPWRRSSTYMFVRSIGLLGVKTRAKRVWMQELGYDGADATILAKYQMRANLYAFVGFFTLGSIAASCVQR